MKKDVFRTTANVDIFIYQKINDFVYDNNLKFSKIITDIILLTIELLGKKNNRCEKLSEYQNHESTGWEKAHYELDGKQVDIVLSARFRLRISISKLLYIGVLLFWREIVKMILGEDEGMNEVILDSYPKIFQIYKNNIEDLKKRFKIIQKE